MSGWKDSPEKKNKNLVKSFYDMQKQSLTGKMVKVALTHPFY